jgi:hypothetical protein
MLPPLTGNSTDDRAAWENRFIQSFAFLDQVATAHQNSLAIIQKDQGTLNQTLQEVSKNLDPAHITLEYQRMNLPILLAHSFTNVETDFEKFWSQQTNPAEYPIIRLIKTRKLLLSALQFVPSLVEFYKLLQTTFGGTFLVQDAKTKTISECIELTNEPVKGRLYDLFTRFKQLWNYMTLEVNRFECQEIAVPEVTLESSLILITPHKKHSPLAVTILKGICDAQNQILNQISTYLTETNSNYYLPTLENSARRGLSNCTLGAIIGSDTLEEEFHILLSTMTSKPMIDISLPIYKQTNVSWNLMMIEAELLQKYFIDRPYLEDDSLLDFHFIEDDPVLNLNDIQESIPQVDIPNGMLICIVKSLIVLEFLVYQQELQNSKILELSLMQLNVILNLLLHLKGNYDPNRTIEWFTSEILHDQPKCKLMSLCSLKHLLALEKLLGQFNQKTAFDKVLSNYRVALTEVIIYCDHFHLQFL